MKRSFSLTLSQRLYGWAACTLLVPVLMLLVAYGAFEHIQNDLAVLRDNVREAEAIGELQRFAENKQHLAMERLLVPSAKSATEGRETNLALLQAIDAEAEQMFTRLSGRIPAADEDSLVQHWELLGKTTAAAVQQTAEAGAAWTGWADMIAAKKEFSACTDAIAENQRFRIGFASFYPTNRIKHTLFTFLMICVICGLACLLLSYFLISTLTKELKNVMRQLAGLSERLAKAETSTQTADSPITGTIAADLSAAAAALGNIMKGE